MAFIVFLPSSRAAPPVLMTSNNIALQVWQELIVRRHLGASTVNIIKDVAPWIDQARTYFLDAAKSDWRSGGLLYYYSFLNAAKALLAERGIVPAASLRTTSIYHGLAANAQSIANLTEFVFQVFPARSPSGCNVFSSFYEIVTGNKWPFAVPISIKVSDIIGFSIDISTETTMVYGIPSKFSETQSLLRIAGNQAWFEMVVSAGMASMVQSEVAPWKLTAVGADKMDQTDKSDWLASHYRTATSFSDQTLLRSDKMASGAINTLAAEASKIMDPFSVPTVFASPIGDKWFFVPRIELAGQRLKWHPMLTDYLFAFVLSTILRYQPHLLERGDKNHFVGEAWCMQAPLTVCRYLLMLVTEPPVRIQSY